jgi:hypothetical protein
MNVSKYLSKQSQTHLEAMFQVAVVLMLFRGSESDTMTAATETSS